MKFLPYIATCSPGCFPYPLAAGEALLFQSPDYPKSISSGNMDNAVQCYTSFTRKDNNGSLLIYLLNGNMGKFTFANSQEIDSYNDFGDDGYT